MTNTKPTIKAERTALLHELNLTEEEMNQIWKDCVKNSYKCRVIADTGRDWTDLALSEIRKLPNLVEETKKYQAEKERIAREKQEQKEKEEQEKEYYKHHFDELMLKKIDSEEELTSDELSELVYGYDVETNYDDNRRWTRTAHTIVKLADRYFEIEWEEGLTEYQENEFLEQPVEVVKHEYQKTITVVEWLAK
jgi:hypothetical protein